MAPFHFMDSFELRELRPVNSWSSIDVNMVLEQRSKCISFPVHKRSALFYTACQKTIFLLTLPALPIFLCYTASHSERMKSSHNTAEFVHLLTSHQEVIRAYITTLLPNYQNVADVLQDVNVKLWERQASFKIGTNFGAWACTMARYCVLTHRSKLKRQRWLLFSDELVEKLAEPTANDLDSSYLQDRRTALHYCLKKLKPRERELLRARYHEDITLAEHAEKIGTTAQTLRVSLHRIRMALKNCVKRRLRLEGDPA